MYFLREIEKKEIQSLLKIFFVKFLRGLIFADYQIRNFSRGFNSANSTFENHGNYGRISKI